MAATHCMIQLVRSPAQGPRDRPVTWRQHGLCRGPAPSGLTDLHARAHWPVRLNGRACSFTPGPANWEWWPWAGANGLPILDQYGRRFYHPHSLTVYWPAPAGACSLTVTVRHNYTAPPYPQLLMPARPDLGITAQSATAGAATGTPHQLTINIAPSHAGLLRCLLQSTNQTGGEWCTWESILSA